MKKQKVTPILSDTYIAVIKNSVGSNMFRNLYAEVDGKKIDIIKNGNLACAWFVSSLLSLFQLIKKVHVTVDGTVADLKQYNWKGIKGPRVGSVLIWEKIDFGNKDLHRHIGFYIGGNKAISTNSLENGKPTIHHWTFGTTASKPNRNVELILWNKKLN